MKNKLNEIKKSKVAIILVNYNGIDDSLKCIESINESTCIKDIDILFVDNASKNDETLIVKDRYPSVITFRSDINGGFSYGNNIAIKCALEKGYEYICLLNNDTVIDKHMMELLRSKCDSNTATTCKMYYYSKPNVINYAGGHFSNIKGLSVMEGVDKEDCDDFNELKEVSFISGACIMLHKDTINKTGFLDESYFMYWEDDDYSKRLSQNNIKMLYIPEAKLWHKVGSSSGGKNSKLTIYYNNRNRFYFLDKYNFSLVAKTYTYITRIIRCVIGFVRNDNDKYILQAYIDYKKGIRGKSI